MAIAFDAVTQSTGSGTSLTFNHTATGSSRIAIAYFFAVNGGSGDPTVVSATYNGVSMTSAGTQSVGQFCEGLYYIINPPTGSQSCVFTFNQGGSAITLNGGWITSYTGAKQTGQPDAVGSGGAASSPINAAVTVVTNNSWVVAGLTNRAGGTNGTSSTQRGTTISGEILYADTNAGVAPGSQAVVFTSTLPNGEWLALSIAPDTSGTTTLYRSLLGVGI